jgi:hypothetical protein
LLLLLIRFNEHTVEWHAERLGQNPLDVSRVHLRGVANLDDAPQQLDASCP